jgi:hypothetical protein
MIDEAITIQMLTALRSDLEAKKRVALAEMMVYLRNPVGVGEHSNFIAELDGLLSTISEASDKIETLDRHFQIGSPDAPPQQPE